MRFEFVETPSSRIEVMLGEARGPVCFMHPEAFGGISGNTSFAERLSSLGLTFVGMNPRGSGGSTGTAAGITLRDMAGDAIAVLERFGKADVFIGHAGGNRVGRMVATLRPDLVGVLVLLAAGGKVPPSRETMAAAAIWRNTSLPWQERLAAAETCFLAPGNHFPPDFPWPDYSFEAADIWRAAGDATETDEWWAGGTARILVVQGAQDLAAPPENGRLLAEEFSERVDLVDIEGAGHFPHLEQPNAALAALASFLARQGIIFNS